MPLHRSLALSILALASLPALSAPTTTPVAREQVGNRTSENIPAIPPALVEQLSRYQNTRGATFAGWSGSCMLISTRFAETAQAHRVCQPMGMREQLTFYPEPLAAIESAPAASRRDGFVFGKDVGGNEFWQLHWFDLKTRTTTLLSDGKARNQGPLFSHDGSRFAWSSTVRNGTDTDLWVMDFATKKSRALITEGGSWNAMDFSPDGKLLLVMRYVSAAETYPGVVDVDSGKLQMFPVDGGKASFKDFKFAPDGKTVYFISNEAIGGIPQEFHTLRYHNPATGKFEVLTAATPWDVEDLEIADDGRHLAYTTNEGGIYQLHVLALPSHKPVKLPELPIGLVVNLGFSPDGNRLAVTMNSATSPSDVHVIDLAKASLTRWTQSEVGGLDPSKFVAPTLIHYPTFDTVDGKPRMIPAFYYRPANVPAGKRIPVVINIHGGPEGQSLPTFNPTAQFLANELGVAMLLPNVRGSEGYGMTYLDLDNADKREDSVKDIGGLLDWIGQQPGLDAGRVGVYGGSYGGYMVLSSLMHYGDRIKAGIDIVGISHFGTFLKNTENYRRDLRRAEYGDERDPAMALVFDRISPLNHAARISSKLFVAQGKNDPRVPYSEAEQIVKAVRGNGQPVWYLLFNDEGHGFRKKTNVDYFGAASILFWQQNLIGGPQPDS
ncbi:prolyl oligopeptidase family serine peptidase [Lysobacter sp. S4-A87]|uniref:S9 family peptidase n=1 Tax=Lysobacter sp. S4-A87 TaxID=2925843 RepID=UPI001F5327D2|nr:prolyl oligopeptidase family serine peptidase [Lysobacter sp. S4-A87]UNK48075.1 prolyl oligopeptidase family serine peptidase [Lysobacter sp. S4-A87]